MPEEQKPKEEKPVEVPEQQPAQVATLIEQSSGAAQHGGDATEHRIYLGQLRKLLEKSKINPRSPATGTVVVEFGTPTHWRAPVARGHEELGSGCSTTRRWHRSSVQRLFPPCQRVSRTGRSTCRFHSNSLPAERPTPT